MADPSACPTAEVWEGIATGQTVSPALQDHLSACAVCRKMLQQIRDDNQFLNQFAVNGILPTAPPHLDHEPTIPGYEIVREIHRGGQGVVYQAVQQSTRREVAIKVMKQGPFATLADRARFDREIETLGKLNHSNIVAIHDAGAVGGFHYFVMNYVDGKPLDEVILDFGFQNPNAETINARNDEPAAPPQSKIQNPKSKIDALIVLFIKICDAVHAAHLRGVIHRDLKPSNIRVDRAGEPHILDFGLAKSTEAEGESAMTRTGQFVGSLPWAAPEQVEGAAGKIDLRTDVYSLGTIFFQLLTGQLPFDPGSNLREAIDHILFREPPRPSAVLSASGGARLDDELDTIALKCLAKDRDRRYQSAGELARDLRRYLAGEPIEAKRDSAMYVLRKTLRRYRLRVVAASIFVVLLGIFGVVMAVLYRRSARLEQEAVHAAVSLTQLLTQSNIERGRMAGMLGNLPQAEQLLWRELLTRREPGETGQTYWNAPPGPPEAYWALWELYRHNPCLRTLTPEPAANRTATLADDGTNLWTIDVNGFAQKLDPFGRRLDTFQLNVSGTRGLPFVDPSGTILQTFNGQSYSLWRRSAGACQLLALPPLRYAEAGAFCLGRGATRFAILLDGQAAVWDMEPFAEVARFSGPQAGLAAVALSNDNRRLAARDQIGRIHVWDIASGRRIGGLPSSAPPQTTLQVVGPLLFSPDDRRLADAWIAIPGRILDWSADPPTILELSERPGDYRFQHFSPDGRYLAIGDQGGMLRIFDTRNGRRVAAFAAHAGHVRGIAFTRDGGGVWTCGDHDLRLWETTADAGTQVFRIEDEGFHGIDVSPDGQRLFTGTGRGNLYGLETRTLAPTNLAFGEEGPISSVAVSPDGRFMAAATYGNAAFLWDTRAPQRPPLRLSHSNPVSHVCFSPDSARIATACDFRGVQIWRCADGALEHEYRFTTDRIPQIAFDPAGKRIAAAVRSGALLVWDFASGACETWSPATGTPLRTVRFSPDGRWLITGGGERTIQIWDVTNRRRAATLAGHHQEIYCLDISADGAMIASGDSGGRIRLWSLSLRRPLTTLDGHTSGVMALRFAPDQRTLVSASLDGTVREWDLTYYERHVAGQVETQLQRLEPSAIDPAGAAAWRDWALRRIQEQATGTPANASVKN